MCWFDLDLNLNQMGIIYIAKNHNLDKNLVKDDMNGIKHA
jgi:hypothetical protein